MRARPPGDSGPHRHWIVSPLLFASLVALFWLFLASPRARLDLFEDGHWLGIASDMLAGKVPYRETFPVHGFLADGGLDTLLFKIFQPSYAVSVQAHNFLAALFHPALFLLAAYATRHPWISLATVVFSIGATTAIGADRPVLALLSLALFVRALDETAPALPAFFAGALAGLGALYALDFGSFVIAGECVVLAACAWQRWRRGSCPLRISAFAAGAGLVVLVFGIYLWRQSALAAFCRVSFLDLPRHIGKTWGVPFPWPPEILRAWAHGHPFIPLNPGSTGIEWVDLGIAKRLYAAPAAALLGLAAAALAIRRRGFTPGTLRLLGLSVACACFFRYVTGRLHFQAGNALVGPLVLLLLVELAGNQPREPRARWRVVTAVALGLCFAIGMNAPLRTWRVGLAVLQYRSRQVAAGPGEEPLDLPRGGGVIVPRAAAERLRALVAFANDNSAVQDYVLDLSNQPALYFFLQRRNPTRFYQVPLMAPFQDEVIRSLTEHPPRFVVFSSGNWLDRIDHIPNAERIPDVWQWVSARYPRRVPVSSLIIGLPPITGSSQSRR